MDFYRILVLAVAAGAVLGALAALWVDFPEPPLSSPAPGDSLAYEASAVVEEARKIAREAAGDA